MSDPSEIFTHRIDLKLMNGEEVSLPSMTAVRARETYSAIPREGAEYKHPSSGGTVRVFPHAIFSVHIMPAAWKPPAPPPPPARPAPGPR